MCSLLSAWLRKCWLEWSRKVFDVGRLKGIADPRLGVEVRGRGPGRACLEGFVQAFVGAVLLGAAGRGALVGDAELSPGGRS